MMLEALADKLASASVGVVADNLFIGILPDQPDLCIGLYEYSGAEPLQAFNDPGVSLERPSVQVMVRGARNDYPTARGLMADVRDVLSGISNETISGITFLRVEQLSSINAVGYDDNDRPLFQLSLIATVERDD